MWQHILITVSQLFSYSFREISIQCLGVEDKARTVVVRGLKIMCRALLLIKTGSATIRFFRLVHDQAWFAGLHGLVSIVDRKLIKFQILLWFTALDLVYQYIIVISLKDQIDQNIRLPAVVLVETAYVNLVPVKHDIWIVIVSLVRNRALVRDLPPHGNDHDQQKSDRESTARNDLFVFSIAALFLPLLAFDNFVLGSETRVVT